MTLSPRLGVFFAQFEVVRPKENEEFRKLRRELQRAFSQRRAVPHIHDVQLDPRHVWRDIGGGGERRFTRATLGELRWQMSRLAHRRRKLCSYLSVVDAGLRAWVRSRRRRRREAAERIERVALHWLYRPRPKGALAPMLRRSLRAEAERELDSLWCGDGESEEGEWGESEG